MRLQCGLGYKINPKTADTIGGGIGFLNEEYCYERYSHLIDFYEEKFPKHKLISIELPLQDYLILKRYFSRNLEISLSQSKTLFGCPYYVNPELEHTRPVINWDYRDFKDKERLKRAVQTIKMDDFLSRPSEIIKILLSGTFNECIKRVDVTPEVFNELKDDARYPYKFQERFNNLSGGVTINVNDNLKEYGLGYKMIVLTTDGDFIPCI